MTSASAPTRRMSTAFFHSIRFRLTMWFVAILALVLAVFSGVIYWTESRSLSTDAARRLEEQSSRAQSVMAELQVEHEAEGAPAVAQGFGSGFAADDVLILTDAQGAIVGAGGRRVDDPQRLLLQLQSAPPASGQAVFVQELSTSGADGASVRRDFAFVRSPIGREGQNVGYLIYGRQSDVADQERRLAISLVIGNLVMLVIAFLGGLWLADRAMRPVAAITRAARSIKETDLGHRLRLPGRDELADLAATFDEMLARLQSAFERQRRFVADSSHELRTPLAIINLEAGRALEGQRSGEEYRASLRVIDAEGRRMARLVNDLMTLARMDAGQTVMDFKPLDLAAVAHEVLQRLGELAAQRGVRLIPGNLPGAPILGDRQYLLQAISNLVENGIKYSGAGSQVRVEIERQAGNVLLQVSDTGPGIPAAHVPLLFDRFYQVDAARSQNEDTAFPQGSGLGLSIARSIIQAHHGEIRVFSEVDHGTRFEVTLPLHDR